MFENDVTELPTDARSIVADGVQAVREKGAEVGRRAALQVDASRAAVASGLQSAADGIHGSADAVTRVGTTMGGMAHGAADTLASTARYVREHKTSQMFAQVEDLVRVHPGKSMLVAVAIGYIAGRALRRD